MHRLRELIFDTDEVVLAPGVAINADPVLASWTAAAAEARGAYRRWCAGRDAESYAVYRACADRADAAQDALRASAAAVAREVARS